MWSVILYLSPPLSETGRRNHLEKKDNDVGIDSGLFFPFKIKKKKKKKNALIVLDAQPWQIRFDYSLNLCILYYYVQYPHLQ